MKKKSFSTYQSYQPKNYLFFAIAGILFVLLSLVASVKLTAMTQDTRSYAKTTPGDGGGRIKPKATKTPSKTDQAIINAIKAQQNPSMQSIKEQYNKRIMEEFYEKIIGKPNKNDS